MVDADLSSFTFAADKVIRVNAPAPYIAHFEFQSGADPGLDQRMLAYNVLLRSRHHLPERSAAILLRPEARSTGNAGGCEPPSWLEFTYRLIRVWEQPPEPLLAGGLGTLPLAPISAVRPEQLPDVVRRMGQRLEDKAPPGGQGTAGTGR